MIMIWVFLSQELLALLSNLDKRKVGYVSLDEFVHNLQLVHNAAVVDSTPIDNKGFLKRAHCEVIVCIIGYSF